MNFNHYILLIFLLFFGSFISFAQKDSVAIKTKEIIFNGEGQNPLSPAKAAFYSAIFPGGGQIYNKKYWKVPIVWAALGVSTYFYVDNTNKFNRYRKAFKLRQQGIQDEYTLDDGTILISTAGLEQAQRTLQKNRDLSLLIGALLYVLQVVEASVNAHLLQFNTDDNLSIHPAITNDSFLVETPKFGLTLKYSF